MMVKAFLPGVQVHASEQSESSDGGNGMVGENEKPVAGTTGRPCRASVDSSAGD